MGVMRTWQLAEANLAIPTNIASDNSKKIAVGNTEVSEVFFNNIMLFSTLVAVYHKNKWIMVSLTTTLKCHSYFLVPIV